jgi:hypothetical protein
MGFLDVAADLVKGVVKVGGKVGGFAVQAIKRGIAKRKDKKAQKRAGLDPLQSATEGLLDGSTKFYRDLVSEQKDKARAIAEKIKFYRKLVAAGASETEARGKVGLSLAELNLPATFFTGTSGEYDEVLPESETPVAPVNKGCLVNTIIIVSTFASFIAALILILIKL